MYVCCIESAQEDSLNITSIPKLHELDRIEGNGKVVKVIEHVASTWNKVALRLHFNYHDVNRISRDFHQQSVQAISAVLTEWLEGKGRKPVTWETLILALKEGEYLTIANDLEVIFGVRRDTVVGTNVNIPQSSSRFKCTLL